jgi:iron(III) transport system ATP-binding protein
MLTISELTKYYTARGGAGPVDGEADASGDSPASSRSRRAGRAARRQGRVQAVKAVSLEVKEGELFTLLGPSGCGKTTTLRCIAGLETPDGGSITLGDVVLCDGDAKVHVPANRRGIGMVFQSYAIWPHMSVYANVAFPLTSCARQARLPRAEVTTRVNEALETVELGGYQDRRATQLSGGQQQRLALARALAMRPRMLLLDEPLSNLDAQLRESMRLELKRLQRELGITTVYVTHDQTEALMLSNRIAVMHEGRVRQIGRPRDIYHSPADRFVAEFVGTTNMLEGRVIGFASGSHRVETEIGVVHAQGSSAAAHDAVAMTLRPEAIVLAERGQARHDAANSFDGIVISRAFRGDSSEHVVVVRERELRIVSSMRATFRPGTEVTLTFDADAAVIIGTPAAP